MRLDGGIDEYGLDWGSRYLTNKSPYGRKVRYLQENSWGYDIEHANNYFKKDQVLTVKEIYMGRSSSKVEFVELPMWKFNTAMFEDVSNNAR